jgi:type IX secretion system PorP/SprF family membrane protein
MKLKYFIIGISCLAISLTSWSQQDPQTSMYQFNPLAVNPAYAGSAEGLQTNILYRSQWTGLPGAPKTFTANLHAPLFKESVGIGIAVSNDQLGVFQRTQATAVGSYHLKMKTWRIAFGLQMSYSQYNIGLADVNHSIDGSVDNAFSADFNQSTFNFGTGLFAYGKNWYGSIAVPHFKKNILSTNSTSLDVTAFEAPHFFAQAGYVHEFNPMWAIKPNTMVKYASGAPVSADLNIVGYYKRLIGLGIGYRSDKSIIALTEIQLHPFLKIGYAYDYGLSSLATYAASSHEIFLRYAIGQKGIHISPRLF